MPDSPDTPDPGYDTVPVDHDPFEDAHGQGPHSNVASSVVGTAGGLAQRAYDWWQNQPSWTERAQGVSNQAQQMRDAGASEADIARATMQQRADLMGGFVGSVTPGGPTRVQGFKGLYPYDWESGPVTNGRGQIISETPLRELTEINNPARPYAGFFSSDPEVANRFANAFSNSAGMRAAIDFKSPLVIDAEGKPAAAFQFESVAREHNALDDYRAFQSVWDNPSHDGVIIKNTKDEGTVYVPRNPEQIAPQYGELPQPPGILAYHGSPYDFSKFDLSKIGTGEGAQAYGHGLYFAENPETARAYREKLAGTPTTQFGDSEYAFAEAQKAIQQHRVDNPINNYLDSVRGDVMKSVARHVVEDKGQDLSTPQYINDVVESYPKDVQDQIREWANQARDLVKPNLNVNSPGRMYQVRINADPEHFLDWDKPLSEQSEHVKNAVASVDKSLSPVAPPITQIKDPQIRGIVRSALKQNEGQAQGLELMIDNDSSLYNAATSHAKRNGVDLDAQDMRASDYVYQQAKDYIDKLHASQNLMGDSLGKVLGVKGADMMQAGPAAARLRSAGIPGIKYLDQGSRSGGEGTRNYVVFDDSLIDILKKYSLAGLIAGGAAHFSTLPVDHDPYGDQVTPKRAQGGAIKGRRERVKEILKRNGVAA